MQNVFQWQIKYQMQNIEFWKNTVYTKCNDVLHNLIIISEVSNDHNITHLHYILTSGYKGVATDSYIEALYICRIFLGECMRKEISSFKKIGLEGGREIYFSSNTFLYI